MRLGAIEVGVTRRPHGITRRVQRAAYGSRPTRLRDGVAVRAAGLLFWIVRVRPVEVAS